MGDDKHGNDSVEIANLIEGICHGRDTVSVFVAISMVLGAAAAKAKRPDFDEMINLVEQTARWQFDQCMLN